MQHLKLHEEVRLVSGYLRAVAYDLPRGTFTFLPKDLVDFLLQNDRAPMPLIEGNPLFTEHAEFLAEKEIFFTEDHELIDNFTPLNLEWKSPFLISSVIIDIAGFDNQLLQKQAQLFRDLNIKHVHYNFLQLPSIEETTLFLSYLEGSPAQSIIVLIKDTAGPLKQFEEQCAQSERITTILLPSDFKGDPGFSNDALNKTMYYNLAPQPKRSISNFTININVFTEAQQHNVYFNKKLYIDAEGNLKNTPETDVSIGNLKTIQHKDELIALLGSDTFTKYGRISKDNCEVCNHCEFRYMCMDDRLPKQRPEGHYYFDTECSYNPFIAKWEGEEGFLPISDCGLTINGLDEPLLHEAKYDSIIKELWD